MLGNPPVRTWEPAILVEAAGERLWRLEDFRDLPFTAVAQTLSRLAKSGLIERLSKGIYYRPRQTALGKSQPNPATLQGLALSRQKLFPSGLAAANVLGFTTQSPRRVELATSGLSLPRKLVGADAVIHTRRPEAWGGLTSLEAALLELEVITHCKNKNA
jgi:predicted transcriptional regulator of viral defense system